MKKIIYILTLMTFLISCEDVLDKVPQDKISDAAVWDSETLIDSYLASLYARIEIDELKDNQSVNYSLWPSMAGSGRTYGTHQDPYKASLQIFDAGGAQNFTGFYQYMIVQDINYFIDKIENESSFTEEYKTIKINEAKFLRAYVYWKMVIRYGGVPIITKSQDLETPEEELYVSRDSEQEVYDFLISELSEVFKHLPDAYGNGYEKGRPTKWTALHFKSRVALYAASIAKYGTTQTVSAPQKDLVLGIPASDMGMYAQIAWDAADSVINLSGRTLYKKSGNYADNYQQIFLDEDPSSNTELLWSVVYDYSVDKGGGWTERAMPDQFSDSWNSFEYLYDWVEKFEFADGTPGTSISRDDLNYGTNRLEWTMADIFGNRDPRFIASVFYPETVWNGESFYGHKNSVGNRNNSSVSAEFPAKGATRDIARTPIQVKKRTNPNITPSGLTDDSNDFLVMRLGETYLNKAEAAYYLYLEGDKTTAEVLSPLNDIRDRVGMPHKVYSTDDQLEKDVQNERNVELNWEFLSYWDLIRWRQAKTWIEGETGSKQFTWLTFIYNFDTDKYRISIDNAVPQRIFHDYFYYMPIGSGHISSNPNMVENPGY